jgi:hypothetical protein
LPGWPNGSGGCLQSSYIWVQLPSPASAPNPYTPDIAKFLCALKREGLKETTIVQNYSKVLRNITESSKLDSTDSVLSYIASKGVSDGRKANGECLF